MSLEKKPLGRILLEQRAVSPEQLQKALADKGSTGRLASRLTEQGVLREVDALKALSEQFGVPGIDLGQICLRLEELDLLPREIAEQHLILPVLVRDDQLFVAVANPRETKVLEELEFVTSKKVYPYVALEGVLRRVIATAYGRKARGEQYYVAPRCPAEVLERIGLNSDGSLRESFAEIVPLDFEGAPSIPELPPQRSLSARPVTQRPGSIPDQPVPKATPVLIVNDAVRLSASEDIEEQDFGQVSRDLSVVSEMPREGTLDESATGRKTVLVVDDDLDIRKMVVRLLRSRGLEVLEADRGLLALRMVKDHNPSLIVLDAMLPEVHGFDIAKRIKNSKRYGRIPIIMISAVYRGWRFAEDLKQSVGVDRYLEKPFRIEDLLRAVDECLSGGSDEDADGGTKSERLAEAEAALLAGVEAYKAGRLPEAIEHLKRGISIDPLAYRLHFHLGLLYGKGGQVFEAIGELEAAMDLNAKHFAAAKNLAILYQKAGFRNKAAEAWERALRLAPDDDTRRTIKDHLLNLL